MKVQQLAGSPQLVRNCDSCGDLVLLVCVVLSDMHTQGGRAYSTTSHISTVRAAGGAESTPADTLSRRPSRTT